MKIFISSTVYDLRDLRSALEYHLTVLGHEVLISEAGSFNPDQGANSYDACLQKIDEAHVFILLIGSRVGGRFPGDEWISITRAEYRRAYARAQSGLIQILTFVRKEIQDVIADRTALIRHLQQARAEYATTDVHQVDSPIIRDADHIMGFVAEVSRRDEMRAAVAGAGPLPIANWVFYFTSFSDVLSPVLQRLASGKPLERLHLESCLRGEVAGNLRTLSQNGSPTVPFYPITEMGRQFCESCPFQARIEPISVNRVALGRAVLNLPLVSSAILNCTATWTTKCMESAHFYEFNTTTHAYQRSQFLEYLVGVNRFLTAAKGTFTTMKVAEVVTSFVDDLRGTRETVPVEPLKLMPLQLAWATSIQFFRCSLGLYHHLVNGSPLEMALASPSASDLFNDASGLFRDPNPGENRAIEELLARMAVPPPIGRPRPPAAGTTSPGR